MRSSEKLTNNAKVVITGQEQTRGDGRDLVIKMGSAPVDALTPDPKNRRLFSIQKSVYDGEPLSAEQCFDELWKMNSVKQLYNSILTAGGITEPLYVTHKGKVIEGNERLTCLNRISMALDAGGIFEDEQAVLLGNLIQNVPIKILPDDTSEREKLSMLASWHLGGKDEWDPVNQARTLWEMNNIHGFTATDIGYTLRKSRTWVHQRLKAYEWSQEYFDRHGTWDKTNHFSYFEELYKRRNALKKGENPFNVEDQENLHQFMDWVATNQIPRALEVRKLPKVLEYEQTRELLFSGEGPRAFDELKLIDAAENSPRFASIERMSAQLDRMTWDEYRQIHEKEDFRKIIEDSIERLQNILQVVDGAFKGGP